MENVLQGGAANMAKYSAFLALARMDSKKSLLHKACAVPPPVLRVIVDELSLQSERVQECGEAVWSIVRPREQDGATV